MLPSRLFYSEVLELNAFLSQKEFTHLLLAHGALVKVKNLDGWSPLAEAISYGDRQTSKNGTPKGNNELRIYFFFLSFSVCSLLQKLKSQAREQMEERRPNLIRALKQMGDFYMELKWDFQSWGRIVDGRLAYTYSHKMMNFLVYLQFL